MEMTKSLADNCAKILPALGVAAVVELRFIRKRVAQLDRLCPNDDLPKMGFRWATVVWFFIVASLAYYEIRCLIWLSVDDNPDRDPHLAESLLWLMGTTLVLLVLPAAVINARAAITGNLKGDYN
ncbi:hypothetical protein ACWGLP_21310 [Streptomyces lydicus]|uniref:hypothetical protein n=1 Tax=Streptomyces lydicus TaxID=47763 RepID=UPI0037D91073